MSVLDKLLDAVKLNDDYDEDDYLDDDLLDSDDDDFLDDDQEDKPVKKFFQKFSKKADDEEVDDFDDEEPVAAAPKQPVKTVSTPKVSVKQDKPVRSTSSKITPMRSSRKGSQAANMEVCVIRPTSMEDTREIADTLVDNSTVVLNLEGLDMDIETLKSILKVDKDVWEKEAEEIEEHYKKFGDKLPEELREQLDSLKSALAKL